MKLPLKSSKSAGPKSTTKVLTLQTWSTARGLLGRIQPCPTTFAEVALCATSCLPASCGSLYQFQNWSARNGQFHNPSEVKLKYPLGLAPSGAFSYLEKREDPTASWPRARVIQPCGRNSTCSPSSRAHMHFSATRQ